MLKLSEEKWLDFKEEYLDGVDYELEEEELFYFDDRSHKEIPNGNREIYLFEKNGNDVKLQVDIVPKVERHEGSSTSGSMKVSYSDVEGEFMYKVSVFVRDGSGTWRDSSSFDSASE